MTKSIEVVFPRDITIKIEYYVVQALENRLGGSKGTSGSLRRGSKKARKKISALRVIRPFPMHVHVRPLKRVPECRVAQRQRFLAV